MYKYLFVTDLGRGKSIEIVIKENPHLHQFINSFLQKVIQSSTLVVLFKKLKHGKFCY